MFLTGYNADYSANIDENEEISIEEFRANVEMMNRLMAENVKNMEKGKMTLMYNTLLLKYVKQTIVLAHIFVVERRFYFKINFSKTNNYIGDSDECDYHR